jgi:hypothetical protein
LERYSKNAINVSVSLQHTRFFIKNVMKTNRNESPAIGRHAPAQGAAANTGAPESGGVTITEDWQTWERIVNGLNLLLAISITEIKFLSLQETEDVQAVFSFSRKFSKILLRHCQQGGAQ